MYPFGWHDRSDGRKARQILVIAVIVLFVLNVVQFVVFRPGVNKDARFRNALSVRLRSNVTSAINTIGQLTRTGGSTTQMLLSQTRQYLYAANQCSEIAEATLGSKSMLNAQLVNEAIEAVGSCEANILAGQSIDTPLAVLREKMDAISASVASM